MTHEAHFTLLFGDWQQIHPGRLTSLKLFRTNLESHPLLNAELIHFLTKSEISELLGQYLITPLNRIYSDVYGWFGDERWPRLIYWPLIRFHIFNFLYWSSWYMLPVIILCPGLFAKSYICMLHLVGREYKYFIHLLCWNARVEKCMYCLNLIVIFAACWLPTYDKILPMISI